MKPKNKVTDSLNAYRFNQAKPYFTLDNLSCYQAQHKDNGLAFTLKIVKKADPDVVQYLRKMKSNNSQYTIKIHELIYQQQTSQLLLVQQAVNYGTLKNALKRCRRLDDDDCVTVAKTLLQGHIQLLRTGIYWYGDQNDIQITENGIKLSWNNTLQFSLNNDNPFPRIIQNIGERKSTSSILVFTKNKMLQDLIQVSRQNASQMSLHPLLKKKDKVFRKKGKDWIGIKQSKVKGQYMQQLSYLGVSKQFGFVRIKYLQKGTLDPQIIKIFQTHPSFIKILHYYQQNNNFITISQYSNDGTVQNYVKRLKNSSIQLKQNQIQFFFYSLIQPLKFLHKSPVVSFNFLHIKNIYIHDGIVKIGQPTPMTQVLKQILRQHAKIADFYHSQFKANPQTKTPQYDTYSLGVLIYKLMYTEYPIFPQNSVHIPSTPTYKEKLKTALRLFLDNRPSSLQELEQKISVSQDVKAQVKNNQKALQQGNKGISFLNKKKILRQQISQGHHEIASQLSLHEQDNQEQVKKKGKCAKFFTSISKRGADRTRKYEHLEKSNFAVYRHCTMVTLVLLLYFCAFFIIYLSGLYNLLTHTSLFTKTQLLINGQLQSFIVPNYHQFLSTYEKYNRTNSLQILTTQMQCKLDNKNIYYDFIRPQSPHWYIYLILSLVLMVTILLLKAIQLCSYSTTSVGYHYYDRTIDGANMSRFALSSYIMFQLWFCMVLWAFYYLFNVIFNQQHTPCFGGGNWTLLTQSLLTDRVQVFLSLYEIQFTSNYLIILLVVFLFGLLSFLQITVFFNRINYDQLCNPIFILLPFYVGLLITLRLGVFDKFQPSWSHNQTKIIGNSYINIIGYFPQILTSIEIIICLLVDLLFDKFIDSSIQRLLLDENSFRLDAQRQQQTRQEDGK